MMATLGAMPTAFFQTSNFPILPFAMLHLISIVAFIILAWLIAIVVSLTLAWRRKTIKRTLKRLAWGHAGIVVGLALLLLDFRPCTTTPLMSTADKVAFKQEVHSDSDENVHRLSFSGDELSRGLRSGADLLGMELHSDIAFPSEDHFQLRFALGHPLGYLNGTLEGTARIGDGKLETSWDRLWIGRIPFVGFTRTLSQRLFSYVFSREQLGQKALKTVMSGEIREERARFEITREQNLMGSVATRFQSNDMAEDAALAVSVLSVWVTGDRIETLLKSDKDLFVEGTRFFFEEAKRQAASRSALRQNRTAIMAAGMWMGHAKLARVTGQRLDKETYDRIARTGGRVSVQGRNDLVRHFWVSAAITAFASARVSNLAGITKEEMDSGEGGSGFSFPDLLADRAGVRFAELALSSESNAAAMQSRVAGDWTSTDALATIDGLPEGIRQEAFLSEFGGVGGEGYLRWSNIIDQRLRSSKMIEEVR
jgi:hypothetical protein